MVAPPIAHKRTYTSLKSVLDFLGAVDDINRGGCGIAALAIIRWLKQNKKKTAKPVYLDDDDYPPAHRAPNHIAVKLGKDYIDTSGPNGLANPEIWEYTRVVEESDLITALNTDTWNDDFNRRRWLPVIESELGVDLSDVPLEV